MCCSIPLDSQNHRRSTWQNHPAVGVIRLPTQTMHYCKGDSSRLALHLHCLIPPRWAIELRDVTALIIMPVAIQRDLADASAAVAQATSGSFSFSAATACPKQDCEERPEILDSEPLIPLNQKKVLLATKNWENGADKISLKDPKNAIIWPFFQLFQLTLHFFSVGSRTPGVIFQPANPQQGSNFSSGLTYHGRLVSVPHGSPRPNREAPRRQASPLITSDIHRLMVFQMALK